LMGVHVATGKSRTPFGVQVVDDHTGYRVSRSKFYTRFPRWRERRSGGTEYR